MTLMMTTRGPMERMIKKRFRMMSTDPTPEALQVTTTATMTLLRGLIARDAEVRSLLKSYMQLGNEETNLLRKCRKISSRMTLSVTTSVAKR